MKLLNYFLFFFIVFGLSGELSLLKADLVTLEGGHEIECLVLSDKKEEVAIQIGSDWKVYPRHLVKSVEIWSKFRNSLLRFGWEATAFKENFSLSLDHGPGGFVGMTKHYHTRIKSWTERTPVYRFLMKAEPFREFKTGNPIAYTYVLYLVLFVLLFIGLKIIKELILMVLGLFGFNTPR